VRGTTHERRVAQYALDDGVPCRGQVQLRKAPCGSRRPASLNSAPTAARSWSKPSPCRSFTMAIVDPPRPPRIPPGVAKAEPSVLHAREDPTRRSPRHAGVGSRRLKLDPRCGDARSAARASDANAEGQEFELRREKALEQSALRRPLAQQLWHQRK